MKAAVDGRLRLYPNPTAEPLRQKLARLHRCKPENIIVGNGSDELLALAVRAFVEPQAKPGRNVFLPGGRRRLSRSTVQYFTPSYSLYPVLADIHGALRNEVPLDMNFALPSHKGLRRAALWDERAALTFITTPNAPTGRGCTTDELDAVCRAALGVVVLDEAYADFAGENALQLALRHPHVIVSRTFSKAYSLCFQRVGYFIGHPKLIGALDKIRDSYNVNGLGQVGAEATLSDLPYYRRNFRQIISTRDKVTAQLVELGFIIIPSQTNFILVRPPRFSAELWYKKLRQKKVLVRWFPDPEVRSYLRITMGTPREMEQLIRVTKQILQAG